jgi:flavodoxin
MEEKANAFQKPLPVKALVVLVSYHHKNTEKIARAIAGVLDAPIRAPQEVNPAELQEYDLIGFGSGIYDERNHPDLLDLADKAPPVANGKAFIFSTSGVPFGMLTAESARGFHAPLRARLQAKGYTIVDEFCCAGFNTHSFLKVLGGVNRGRPNAEDLRRAQEFAANLLLQVRRS